jgi:hypothetical protein
LLALVWAGNAYASPIEEAQAKVDEAQSLLKASQRKKGDDKTKTLVRAATKYARAYALILDRNLKNDAPALLKQIEKQIAELARRPELKQERLGTRTKALRATAEGRLEDAYDLFAKLRDLDPRDQTVEYILGVIGQRMQAK